MNGRLIRGITFKSATRATKYGNVTYKSIWLDNIEQDLYVTVPSSFALGWGPALLTNFQIDGLGAKGSARAYVDNLTVYRW